MPQSRKRHTARRTHAPRPVSQQQQRQQARAGAGRRKRIIAAVVVLALVAAGAAYLFAPGGGRGGGGAEVTTPSGLKYTDLVVGGGPSPRPGQTAVVHYTGTLTNGTKFDSSRDRGQPYPFVFGQTPMIKGWDEGISTMKAGGRRRLVVPPALAYGPVPRPNIPANSTLVFDVELLEVK
ncbi:MAG TPA: FKBP-type peptidyl-prolyl cis-trans isomerase [Pyrinomonadaceae bacterium]